MASVQLNNISKVYDKKVTAVSNANLQIDDKEFVVLVGPSGCGKSTLLRMIAGLEEISDGEILISDKIVNDIPPKDRNIAMVFQNYALYPHMTVFDNMAFGLKLRKFSEEQIKKRVSEAAELLGIKEYLDRKPKALSGGQRQRVAVGRAIVRKPEVFLFDEPLSNLDAKLRVQMRIEIKKLHRRLEATMIYVTHDQVEAMTMGDRIVVMKDGVIQQVDTPLNIYSNPVNIFVAGFIGSPAMNFFKGKLEISDQVYFSSNGFQVKLGKDFSRLLSDYNGGNIIMGIRPEHILNGHSEKKQSSVVNAEVEVIESMGNETYVYMKAGDSNLTMRSISSVAMAPGSRIDIYFDLTKIRFFDPKTETAIV
ncbi:MAG: ABC transporter ATP-binding protein [Calditrichaceae bacterium]